MSFDAHERWRDDLAAHLLGSLDASEDEALKLHLSECDRCRQELRWLGPAMEVLPVSVSTVEAPAGLRERIMATVEAEAGEAPAPAAPQRNAFEPRRARFRAWALRPAMGIAATAVIGAGIVGYVANEGGGNQSASTIAAPTQANGIQATLERTGDSGTLELAGLHQLSNRRVYQAWIQRGTVVEPAGSGFVPGTNGTASAAVPRDLDGAARVMVTVESRRGSTHPSPQRVVTVNLD